MENTCIAVKGKLDLSRDKPSFLVSSLQDLGKMRRAAAARTEVSADQVTPGTQLAQEAQIAPGTQSPASSPNKNPTVTQAAVRKVHIRLFQGAVENEKSLYPLRDYIIDHHGPDQVFIHVPAVSRPAASVLESVNINNSVNINDKEKIIRTAVQLSITANEEQLAALENNPIVKEVWVI